MTQEKSKIDKRLEGLRATKAALQKLLVPLGNLYVADRPNQLKALTRALTKIDALRQKKVMGTAKVLTLCANELVSLREGLFTGQISSRSKKHLTLTACSTAITQTEELISKTQRRKAYLESCDDEGNSPLQAAEDDAELLDTIKRNLALKDKLPTVGAKPFVVGRAPVVVVTNASGVQRKGNAAAFVDREKLKKLGFKIDNIDGYAVMHEQLVIGVNIDPDVLGNKSRERVLRAATKALTAATKRNYALVIDKPCAYGKQTLWFWVMVQNDLNLFAQAFPGGRVKLNEWGFAF